MMGHEPEQISLLDFIDRAQKAQAEVTSIIAKSDAKAKARPRARGTDPQTSHKAAKRAGEHLTWSQRAVIECLQKLAEVGRVAVTDPELIESYRRGVHHAENNWPFQSESGLRTRRHELTEMSPAKVVKVGEQEREKGKPFTLWSLTENAP